MDKKTIKNTKQVEKINAEGQSLGRLASRIAFLLQDKHLPHYAPNKEGETFVEVENLEKIKFALPKLRTKIYYHHTRYMGHMQEVPLAKAWEKSPAQVLRKAVRGMLPKNKLRKLRMKRLIIK